MNTREMQQFLVMNESDIQLKILQERNEEICNIEEGIIDNSSLMLQINLMVLQQGQKIDCIEANVHRAIDHTEKGVASLEKAEKHQRCTIL